MFSSYFGSYNRSMELLHDYNNGYKSNPVNVLTTTTFLPKSTYHHSSRRLNYRHILNDIDWNYEIERERDIRDRKVYNDKVMEIKTRRSRTRTTHQKVLFDDKFNECVTKTRSHSDDLKPYVKNDSFQNKILNQEIEIHNKSKKCHKSKKSKKKNSSSKKNIDSNDKEMNDKELINGYVTTASTSNSSTDSVNINNQKENEQLKHQLDISQAVKNSSHYLNTQTILSVVDTGVQTQLSSDESSKICNDEKKYVEELKVQLDSLRNEIGRLQDAQSNLEKSLKTQAAFRPIVLSDFDGKAELGDLNFEDLIPPEYRYDANFQDLTANGLIEIFNGDNKNPFLINQPVLFDPTNALFEQNTKQTPNNQGQNIFNYSVQNPGYKIENNHIYFDPNQNKDNVRTKLANPSTSNVLDEYQIIRPNTTFNTVAAGATAAPTLNSNLAFNYQDIIKQAQMPSIPNNIKILNSNSKLVASTSSIFNSNKNSIRSDPNKVETKSSTRIDSSGVTNGDFRLPSCYNFDNLNSKNGFPSFYPTNLESVKYVINTNNTNNTTTTNNNDNSNNIKPNNKNLPNESTQNIPNHFETVNLRTNGNLKSTNAIVNNNYGNGESNNAKFVHDKFKIETIKHESDEEECIDQIKDDPNALLYERLMQLVSDSSVDLSNEQMSFQINKLLSNPNIKYQLQQLHSQLLANPGHYLPQLENILLPASSSMPGDHNINNLFDIKSFYTNNNDNLTNNNNNNNHNEILKPINIKDNNNPNIYSSNNHQHPTARIISRDFK